MGCAGVQPVMGCAGVQCMRQWACYGCTVHEAMGLLWAVQVPVMGCAGVQCTRQWACYGLCRCLLWAVQVYSA